MFNRESNPLTVYSDIDHGKKSWVSGEEIRWTEKGCTITVPAMSRSDLASIPRMLRWIVSNDDPRIRRAAFLHDWLYERRGRMGRYTLTRLQCDNMFYRALLSDGVGHAQATAMWLAVRIGGMVPWNS